MKTQILNAIMSPVALAAAAIEKARDTAATQYARAGAAVTLGLGAVAANAQTADPFDAVVTEMTTKVEGYGGKLVIFCGVAVVFLIAMKYIRKIPKAA